MVKVTGAFQKSSEIMKVTNQLVKLPQLSATMREMSMEMMKVSVVSILHPIDTALNVVVKRTINASRIPRKISGNLADCQSGIMEEMMEESLDSVNDDEELEQEADAEVDKVLFELTDGKLGQAGKVGAELPVSSRTSILSALQSEGVMVELSVASNATLYRDCSRSTFFPSMMCFSIGASDRADATGAKGRRRGERRGDGEDAARDERVIERVRQRWTELHGGDASMCMGWVGGSLA